MSTHYVPSVENLANGYTKTLDLIKFKGVIENIGVLSLTAKSRKIARKENPLREFFGKNNFLKPSIPGYWAE